MNLTIEQKQLLAEEVMGWGEGLPPTNERKESDTYYQIVLGYDAKLFYYPEGGSKIGQWQPETDEGDAARLLLALPQFKIAKLERLDKSGDTFIGTIYFNDLPHTKMDDFCALTCALALDYATAKRAAREREATL